MTSLTHSSLPMPTASYLHFVGGIATTNYDLLVERTYKRTATAVQAPVPFIENGDRVDDLLRDPKSVPYLKLHGCITRLSNPQCPLILSTDQYIQYRQGRSRLFDQLKGLGYEHPIVFIGHSLQDTDMRAVLLELTQLGDTRPRYFFVGPDVDEIQTRFWESRYKVTPIKATFAEFAQVLDERLPGTFRGLAVPPRRLMPSHCQFQNALRPQIGRYPPSASSFWKLTLPMCEALRPRITLLPRSSTAVLVLAGLESNRILTFAAGSETTYCQITSWRKRQTALTT